MARFSVDRLSCTRIHIFDCAPPVSASQIDVNEWCPSVRYGSPYGPTTSVFMSAGLLPTALVQVKEARSLRRDVAASQVLVLLWPLVSQASSNFLIGSAA